MNAWLPASDCDDVAASAVSSLSRGSDRMSRASTAERTWAELLAAARRLWRDRGSVVVSVALLTIGVTATLITTRALDALLVRAPVHLRDYERAVKLYQVDSTGTISPLLTNVSTIERLASGLQPEVDSIAGYTTERLSVGDRAESEEVDVLSHTRAYFEVLGVSAQMGLLPAAHRQEIADAAVISDGLWRRRFARRPDVIGQPIRVAEHVYAVAAVLPAGFSGTDRAAIDIWLPLSSRADRGALGPEWRTSTDYASLQAVLRLRASDRKGRVEAQLGALYRSAAMLPFQPPKTLFGELLGTRAPGAATREVQIVQWIAAVSALMLLASCGNVTSLTLIRGLRRSRDVSIRVFLGATRAQLIRDVAIEAMLVAAVAGVVALALVVLAGDVVTSRLLPPAVAASIVTDGRLLGLAVLLCMLTAGSTGIVPAFRLTTRRMQAPSQGAASVPARSRWLKALVALQVCLCVPLMAGAALFARSLWQAAQVDFGVDGTNAAVISFRPAPGTSKQVLHDLHRRLADEVRRDAAVRAVALVRSVPLREVAVAVFSVPGFVPAGPTPPPFINSVDPSFFTVMDVRLVAGRAFTDAENVSSGRPVAMVNRRMAQTFWPGRSAIGQCIVVGMDASRCAEVVGIVEDQALTPSLEGHRRRPSMYFVPSEQHRDISPGSALLVRTVGDPRVALSALRRAASAVAPTSAVEVWAYRDLFAPGLRPLRLGVVIFLCYALLAITTAIAGAAAVTASHVVQRRRDLAIRAVLGATPGRVLWSAMAGTLLPLAVGLGGGAAVAGVAAPTLAPALFEAQTTSVSIHAAVVLLLAAGCLAATYLPASRLRHLSLAAAVRPES